VKLNSTRIACFIGTLGLALAFIGCGTHAGSATSAGACPDPVVCPEPQDNPGDPVFTIGDRLRPYQITAKDGLTERLPSNLYFDTVLNAPCAFTSPDGPDGAIDLLCLPEAIYSSKPGWFTDAACTKEVAIVDACPNVPRYLRVSQQDSCYPTMKAFRRLGEPLPNDAVLYTVIGGNCTAQPNTLGGTNLALPIGDEVPWTDFVSATTAPFADPTP